MDVKSGREYAIRVNDLKKEVFGTYIDVPEVLQAVKGAWKSMSKMRELCGRMLQRDAACEDSGLSLGTIVLIERSNADGKRSLEFRR